VGADLVGAERERALPVGEVDVRVVDPEAYGARVVSAVRAARGVLPLVLAAGARARDSPGAIEPPGERERVVP
jgi:hypothetical protein